MLNTVVRQVAFHNFETRLHESRRTAELTAEEISDIWMDTQRAALGPAVKTGDDYRPIWGYVPHFGDMSRISCTRRSTSTPMRLATVW